MAYSDCPQADALTRRLVAAYNDMSDREVETAGFVDDLHVAIMEHKESCTLCRRIRGNSVLTMQEQRVA